MNTETDGLIGFAGKQRLMAAFLDNAIAYTGSLLAIQLLPASPGRWVVLVLLYLAYFAVFEALWSRTPGKALFGLQVRTVDNQPCTWPGAVIRTVLRLLEVNAFLFGALPGALAILLSKRKQRLGDRLANTVVIRTIGATSVARPPN